MNWRSVFPLILILGLALVLTSCAGLQKTKPDSSNFKAPQITLSSFQVAQYDGYWYYSKKIEPTKGEAGDHGAPLPMSFVFEVTNPNPYPVQLQDFTFTISFEGFDLQTVNKDGSYWIPANTTDQIDAYTMITTRSALLSLLVTGGFKLKEKGWSPWDALQRWWTKVPAMDIPVKVKDGSASFKADGVSKTIPFESEYPK